eukprot:Phypoly_transcript_03587.p1 GENE.Phypoly_transcript_03587~~Phypoly_transcript_03587.p1  ORF type:complete len:627 (+),score=58.48 Phypoly_transcript_03587:523-2403(+)
MTQTELEALARLGKEAKKCSRRDIATLVGAGVPGSTNLGAGTGATTVAATAYLARLAHPDLRIFVTGGIGGVHRGWEHTMDVSADLTELGRTDITVICAGAKSILDIPATLEYLETQGVSVVAYQSDFFPSFFTASSGVRAPNRADSTKEIARMILSNRMMHITSGMVVGVPISGQDAMDAMHIDAAIQQALQEADALKIAGRDITPFLLERVNNLTKGDSLHSNIQLVKQNARIGTQIAKELNILLSSFSGSSALSAQQLHGGTTIPTPAEPGVVVFGGAVVDLMATSNNKIIMGSSNPGRIDHSEFMQAFGGVGRNIAEGVSRLLDTRNRCVHLVSAIGNDPNGDTLVTRCKSLNISMEHSLRVDSLSSAIYSATLDSNGELVVSVADMDIFTAITPKYIQSVSINALIANAAMVVVDSNFPVDTIKTICDIAHRNGVPVWFEPTSIAKCTKILKADSLAMLTYISPNRGEMITLLKELAGSEIVAGINVTSLSPDYIGGHMNLVQHFQHKTKIPGIVMKMGPKGVIVATKDKVVHYPAFPLSHPLISVSGAGDSLAAATVWHLVTRATPSKNEDLQNIRPSLHESIKFGLAAAKLSLESASTVSPLLHATALNHVISDVKSEL